VGAACYSACAHGSAHRWGTPWPQLPGRSRIRAPHIDGSHPVPVVDEPALPAAIHAPGGRYMRPVGSLLYRPLRLRVRVLIHPCGSNLPCQYRRAGQLGFLPTLCRSSSLTIASGTKPSPYRPASMTWTASTWLSATYTVHKRSVPNGGVPWKGIARAPTTDALGRTLRRGQDGARAEDMGTQPLLLSRLASGAA
jgi:hypothetical protein